MISGPIKTGLMKRIGLFSGVYGMSFVIETIRPNPGVTEFLVLIIMKDILEVTPQVSYL